MAGALRAARARRDDGFIRFGGVASGCVTVTAGSRPTAATVCAFTGGAKGTSNAAAGNIRQMTARNAHAPA
jgi:hypothetical protein